MQELESTEPLDDELCEISEKVLSNQRLSKADAITLYERADLELLRSLSSFLRLKKHGLKTFFNRNFHIEPTNICVYECSFCSFARKPGEEGGWEHTLEEIFLNAKNYIDTGVTEVHIVGGVHPKRGVEYYSEMIQGIKNILPEIHVKAFTAVELKVMFARSKMTVEEGLLHLKGAGLDSIPGGGAEIFHDDVRSQICNTKASTEEWLNIHETAHKLGIPSNCTILYGHLEKYEHRVHHMELLRELQDKTGGFNTFIPLKFRNQNNTMSNISEASREEDLKNYAISRLFLDNISHIKAYWPMIGRKTAAESLNFGVDDLDGTIDDSTKIYSMAGSEEESPSLTTDELIQLVHSEGFDAVERDTLYKQIKFYPNP